MTTVTKRRHRFARSKAPRDIWISDRALSILRALARFRFLTIDQIITLLDIEQQVYALPPVSRQKVSRLLRDLYDASYVERVLGPVTNLTDFSAVHRMPTTYALAQNGARHLTATDGVPLDSLDWHKKNRRVGSLHIDHTIGVADFVIAVLAASKECGLELIDHHDLIPYLLPSERDTNTLTLSVAVDGVEYTRRPDRLLALSGSLGQRLYFVHEWHSGEMPNRRDPGALWRGHRQKNFADKIWIYWKARQADAFRAVWGASNVRILTVTKSDESIVSHAKSLASRSGHSQSSSCSQHHHAFSVMVRWPRSGTHRSMRTMAQRIATRLRRCAQRRQYRRLIARNSHPPCKSSSLPRRTSAHQRTNTNQTHGRFSPEADNQLPLHLTRSRHAAYVAALTTERVHSLRRRGP